MISRTLGRIAYWLTVLMTSLGLVAGFIGWSECRDGSAVTAPQRAIAPGHPGPTAHPLRRR